jgi:hypothetical protein
MFHNLHFMRNYCYLSESNPILDISLKAIKSALKLIILYENYIHLSGIIICHEASGAG